MKYKNNIEWGLSPHSFFLFFFFFIIIINDLAVTNSNLSNINVWKLDSTIKTDVPCKVGYGAFLVLGYMQNVGAVSFTLTMQDGNASAINLNGVEGALNFLIFEHNTANGVLYISPSDAAHRYHLIVIGYAA